MTVTFPDSVKIEAVYDANLIGSLTTASSFTVELGPKATASSEFIVMGSGTVTLEPTITCAALQGPPPAPPHPDDCILLSQYEVHNVWEAGEIVALVLHEWEAERNFKLTFWGQKITASNVQGARLAASTQDAAGNTVVSLTLNRESVGAYEVVMQISPPARLLPHVICHDPWPPPPPPPPPLPPPAPPPSSPPPPPPREVMLDASCGSQGGSSQGGTAAMAVVFGSTSVRINVALASWWPSTVVQLHLLPRTASFEASVPRNVRDHIAIICTDPTGWRSPANLLLLRPCDLLRISRCCRLRPCMHTCAITPTLITN